LYEYQKKGVAEIAFRKTLKIKGQEKSEIAPLKRSARGYPTPGVFAKEFRIAEKQRSYVFRGHKRVRKSMKTNDG
jgi:hypothetical protein